MSATEEILDHCQASWDLMYQLLHMLIGGFVSFREAEDSKEVKDLLDLLDRLYVLTSIPLKQLLESQMNI